VEVIHIVYDYCFKSITDVQRQRKAAVIDVLKNETCIVVNEMYLGLRCSPRDTDIVTRFMVYPKGFPKEERSIYTSDEAEIYLSYAICPTCGVFVNPKPKASNKNLVMRFPWKRQYCDDEYSPFWKVTCNNMCDV
jgi:hypothetical protein